MGLSETDKQTLTKMDKDWCSTLNNDFLVRYLRWVEDTESPRLFHIWSAITGISACLQRRCYLPFGGGITLYPNIYTFLVGQSGLRKSTAINIMQNLVKAVPNVVFAPEDVNGDKVTLIEAMSEHSKSIADGIDDLFNSSFDNIHKATPLFMVNSELPSLLGYNKIELITFLTKLWDGDDYIFNDRKKKQLKLVSPLASMIGGTASDNLNHMLPPQSIGQGFLARVILVYGDSKYKQVMRPKKLALSEQAQLIKTLRGCSDLSGKFEEHPEALQLANELYTDKSNLSDPRLFSYKERRHIHLMKIAMALAATKGDLTISKFDVIDAHNILKITELGMSEALGEFGLSPLALARQKLIDYMRQIDEPLTLRALRIMMSRDMKDSDFHMTVHDLIAEGKIVKQGEGQATTYLYKDSKTRILESIADKGIF